MMKYLYSSLLSMVVEIRLLSHFYREMATLQKKSWPTSNKISGTLPGSHLTLCAQQMCPRVRPDVLLLSGNFWVVFRNSPKWNALLRSTDTEQGVPQVSPEFRTARVRGALCQAPLRCSTGALFSGITGLSLSSHIFSQATVPHWMPGLGCVCQHSGRSLRQRPAHKAVSGCELPEG
jgi:hypothetical protein